MACCCIARRKPIFHGKKKPLIGAQTPVTCKGPAVDYKRSLAVSAPVFKQAEADVGESSHKHDVALLYSLVQ